MKNIYVLNEKMNKIKISAFYYLKTFLFFNNNLC